MSDPGTVSVWRRISVAVSGTTVIVGAPTDPVWGAVGAGSAYAFAKTTEGTWSQEAKLTAADAQDGDDFGDAVALSGGAALVGAASDDTIVGERTGSAYVFMRSGSLWVEEVKLTAGVDASMWDNFGNAVAFDCRAQQVLTG